MVKNQLPFRFYEVSAVHPEPFQVGGTVSVFDLCGVYLCCEGEVCFSSDDHTYIMHRGDLYIYLPSSVVHLKQLSPDSHGLVMDARIDFALPISNKVMNSENLLCLRQHPTLHLTDEQFDYLQRLMLRMVLMRNRLRILLTSHVMSVHQPSAPAMMAAKPST